MRRLLVVVIAAAAVFGASVPSASAAAGCPGAILGPAGGFGNASIQPFKAAGNTGRELGAALHAIGGFGKLIQVACPRP